MTRRGTNLFDLILRSLLLVAVSVEAIQTPASTPLCNNSGCRCDSRAIVCRCVNNQDIIVSASSISITSAAPNLTISDCNKVTFRNNSIYALTNLRYVYVSNVKNLELYENGFHWMGYDSDNQLYNSGVLTSLPGLNIQIRDTTIRDLSSYVFKGRIKEIHLKNVWIETIKPYAFSSLMNTLTVEMDGCHFSYVQAQAFKKFQTDYLTISRTNMSGMPSRAFSDIEVLDVFRIDGSSFEDVRPGAFIINNPRRVEIVNSYFRDMDGDSFKVVTRGPVTIRNNVFQTINGAAFNSIVTHRDLRGRSPQELLFENNTISGLPTGILSFDRQSYITKFDTIVLNQTCNCVVIERWSGNDEWYEKITCVNEQRSLVPARDYKTNACGGGASYTLIIVISVIAFILIATLVSGLIVYLCKRYGDKNRSEDIQNKAKNGTLGLVVPDGRTYRETELHVIVERADLLTTDL